MSVRAHVLKNLANSNKPWRTKFDVSKKQPFKGKSIISAEQFEKDSILYVMEAAKTIKNLLSKQDTVPLLEGKILANVFLEPSTRTATSFHAAMLRLKGSVVAIDGESSSVQKGETLEDTVRVLESYAEAIVLRHPVIGAADVAASSTSRAPIINAGDGGGEHPTQALLDMFCINSEHGDLTKPMTITLLGDLKYGRTVHSLSQMLSHFPNIKFNLVSPPNLKMPDQYLDLLTKRKCHFQTFDKLEPVLSSTDVLYQTRVQKERFTDLSEYEKSKGQFIITPDVMKQAKSSLILLHPFPRVDEITEDVDKDRRALYFKQPLYGMYLRMALLALTVGSNNTKLFDF
jgi:aspartate carbamoyltransferase